LSSTGAFSTSATARSRSSRYCRHVEYDEYAAVANTSARFTPSAAICRTVSARYGFQFRFPQYSGSPMPAASSSGRSTRNSARHWSLIGLRPSNRK